MKKLISVILLLCIYSICIQAQNRHLRKAQKHEIKGEYLEATISYQLYLQDNKSDISILKKLAEIACKLDDYDSAEMYCEEIINNNQADPQTYFEYIKILRRNGKYDRSIEIFGEFSNIYPNEILKYYRVNTIPDRKYFFENIGNVELSEFSFNTNNSEFSPFIVNNDIYYTSYDNGHNIIEPTTRVGKFINEYITPYKAKYNINKVKIDTFTSKFNNIPFEKLMDSQYHEGMVTVSSSGNVMYFSAANQNEKTTFGHSIVGFDIYEARLVDNKWKITQKLFNVPGKSFAHPCLSRDNSMLYLVSDMDGGYGGTDLYISYLKNGKWSFPENLGPEVNTPGNELYPFADINNTIYFASDGHHGMGGLDIFVVTFENEAANIHNVGAPINSRFDDFGICTMNDNTMGFFSSNRTGGKGEYDIYGFNAQKGLNLAVKEGERSDFLGFITIKGELRDIYSNKLINDAEVTMHDEHGIYSDFKSTTINGQFTFIIPADGEYTFSTSANKYKSTKIAFLNGKSFYTLKAEPTFVFPNIHFDYNSSYITENGKETLNKIVNCMYEYPKTKICIKAYSDIVGEGKDNKKISEERANSIEEYLKTKGIDKKRIVSKSLGTKDPLITLEDNALLDKEDAQSVNRRAEITLIHPSSNCSKN